MKGVCTYGRDARGVNMWKGYVPMQGGCKDVYLGKERGVYLWKECIIIYGRTEGMMCAGTRPFLN